MTCCCPILLLSALLTCLLLPVSGQEAYLRYERCLLLENDNTRVVLCPESGGRVLEYAWKGTNALYLDPAESEKKPKRLPSSAGRFDIGPEYIIPKHPKLWSGAWEGKKNGPRSATLTSAKDEATGVQLIRSFELAADSSHLRCTQTMVNISDVTKNWCYWCRTFVVGNGICVVPLAGESRFPNKYAMVGGGRGSAVGQHILVRPEDPNIRLREFGDDAFLEITPAPAQAKLGFDSQAGWLAYQMPNDLLFVKKWPVDPAGVYNEFAGYTLSIWYPAGRPMVELEPIGPRQTIAPGERASFTEEWWLVEHPHPKKGEALDLKAVETLAKKTMK